MLSKPTTKARYKFLSFWAIGLFSVVCIFSVSSSVCAQSEWTTNGSNINNTNSGNVGIGITDPSALVHLRGPYSRVMKFERIGVTPVYGFEQGQSIFGLYDYTNAIYRWRVYAGNLLLNEAGGNVGIGTTAPSRPLHVKDAGGSYVGKFESTSANSYFEFVDATANSSNRGILGNYQGDFFFKKEGSVYGISFFTGLTTKMKILNNGNVGIGTTAPTAKLHVVGDVTVTGNIAAKYQDVAEWVPTQQQLAAGTVVILDPDHSNHVMSSTVAYDTRVAGVISERPGLTLGESGPGKALVATTGRVRVKVSAAGGAIKIGDLLVTGNVKGVAMRSEPMAIGNRRMHMPGTLIGKALEPLEKGSGEILVLLSLQ